MNLKPWCQWMALAVCSVGLLGCGSNEQIVVPDKVSAMHNTKIEDLNLKENQADQANIPFDIRQRLQDRAVGGRISQ